MNLEKTVHHRTTVDIDREMELVREAQANPARFEPLYDKYYLIIAKYVANRVEDHSEVGDLTQEVFIKALKNIKKFKPTGVPFSAWLFRIAANLIVDHHKKKGRQRMVNLKTETLPDMLDQGYDSLSDERRETLVRVLAQLPEDDLELIELRFFERRSVIETAQIAGISEANVKTRVHRIVKRLKKMIQDEA